MSYPHAFVAALSSLTFPFRNGTPIALLLFLVYFALFLLPGFAVATLVWRPKQTDSPVQLVVTISASAALGFLAFWAFFFSKAFGRALCFAVYAASVFLLIRASRRGNTVLLLFRNVRTPLLYTAATGLLYTSLFFLPSKSVGSDPEYPGARFFAEGRPSDNLIPLFLADRLYDRRPIRPFCCGDWLSSDRPPLQSGVFLLQRPLRVAGGNWLHYQLLATGLQCLWVCGVWCLLLSLGTSSARTGQLLLFLSTSGFLFYNSVYTWPKLFASALFLFAVSILITSIRDQRRTTMLEACAGSCSVGLALLAHPGTIFSLPAFGVLAIRHRRYFSLRQLALPALLMLCLLLPWSAYQRWVDPPGNRLLKMHLGGEMDPTPRSTWQVVQDAYRHHTAGEILRFKLSNLALLAGRSPWDLLGVNAVALRPDVHVDRASAERSRIAQSQYIWNALGVLNLGWAVWLLSALRGRSDSAVPFGPWLAVAGLFNLAIWALVMFGPGATVTTHSSYADILLLSIGLLSWIFTLPRSVVAFAFVLHAVNSLVVWVWPR
ncbi:MAG: hypothetical protein ACJ746_24720 [Bryobacteraceae bacterium]